MITKKLGRTQLDVGVIGLGGEGLDGLSAKEVREIFDVAMEHGVNCLDVFMPQPELRDNIGLALAGRREKMLIQGHFCTVCKNGQYERTRDLAQVKSSFEDLLARLQTDYIDIGMIHFIDSAEDYDSVFETGIIDYVKQLKEQGVIRCIGVSSHNPHYALKTIETGLVDVLMFSINAAYDLEKPVENIEALMNFKGLHDEGWTVEPARQELYAACERLGVGITVMKALGAGTLLSDEQSPFGRAMTVAQCCHYCLTRPGVASVLLGCHSVEELKTALAYCTASEQERDYSPVLAAHSSVSITGHCMYCNHCQPCPAQLDVAAVTKFLDLASSQKEIPATVREHYNALPKTAADCVLCGQCEPRCPFGVPVRENMKRARSLFGG